MAPEEPFPRSSSGLATHPGMCACTLPYSCVLPMPLTQRGVENPCFYKGHDGHGLGPGETATRQLEVAKIRTLLTQAGKKRLSENRA